VNALTASVNFVGTESAKEHASVRGAFKHPEQE
jgi:hypothetical protein